MSVVPAVVICRIGPSKVSLVCQMSSDDNKVSHVCQMMSLSFVIINNDKHDKISKNYSEANH